MEKINPYLSRAIRMTISGIFGLGTGSSKVGRYRNAIHDLLLEEASNETPENAAIYREMASFILSRFSVKAADIEPFIARFPEDHREEKKSRILHLMETKKASLVRGEGGGLDSLEAMLKNPETVNAYISLESIAYSVNAFAISQFLEESGKTYYVSMEDTARIQTLKSEIALEIQKALVEVMPAIAAYVESLDEISTDQVFSDSDASFMSEIINELTGTYLPAAYAQDEFLKSLPFMVFKRAFEDCTADPDQLWTPKLRSQPSLLPK